MRQIHRHRNKGLMLAFVLWALLVDRGAGHGGSLVHMELRGLKSVAIKVLVPVYEPLPGRDQKALKAQLKKTAEEQLAAQAIRTDDTAAAQLLITVDYERGPNGLFALSVLTELCEHVLLKDSERATGADVVATTWRTEQLLLSDRSEVLARIFEAVRSEARDFAQKVDQVRD